MALRNVISECCVRYIAREGVEHSYVHESKLLTNNILTNIMTEGFPQSVKSPTFPAKLRENGWGNWAKEPPKWSLIFGIRSL